ncbi:multicopper oxidase family protein [Frateuria aurantia]
MRSPRRRFLQGLGLLALADLMPGMGRAAPGMARGMVMAGRTMAANLAPPSIPLLNPLVLPRFVDPLPRPSVAQPVSHLEMPQWPGRRLPCYRIEARAFRRRLHRDLPPTLQWGYQGSVPGPVLEARSGEPLLVEWANELPQRHMLPIDHTIHGAGRDVPEVRMVTHVHGARVPADSDGYPEDWYPPGQSRRYLYPNGQDATTLWYHDHAMGITRLNIYAGLFGSFIIRDAHEESLALPRGAHDLPLMLCDRLLGRDGSLYYPVSDDPAAPWVPDCEGNAILCNGMLYPYLDVDPDRYRLRLGNAANTRFFNLSLSHQLPMLQIASDQGLLEAPLSRRQVELYPAERADVVIDFSALSGQHVELRHEGQAILQFRVSAAKTAAGRTLPARLNDVPRIPAGEAAKERRLVIGEQDDPSGSPLTMLLDGKRWSDPISEDPQQNSTEIWSFINVTGDAHPMHLHLVRFQVLDRRPFDLFAWNARRELVYTGPAQPPEAHEAGWKDTVRADPEMVTRIIMRFEGEPGRYVWHCHFLEHEDNEMMRPYQLLPARA